MARGELIAEGTYHLFQDSTDVGHETWQLSRLGHGGMIVSTRVDRTRPRAESWIVSYELSNKWSPRGLTIRLDRPDHWMRTEQRADKDHWVAQVVSPAGSQEFVLDFDSEHEIDFGSPLFHTVTLIRAALAIGQTCDTVVIQVQSGSLAPVAERQSLTCVADEKVEVPAGPFSALKYELRNQGQPDGVTTLWGDARGIVLRQTAPDGQETRLIRYRWLARR